MKLTIRKYDGDDNYSWAVFNALDIKGIKGPILYGQAKPLVCGCSKREAEYTKSLFENANLNGNKT
jgi:hypothetical protein